MNDFTDDESQREGMTGGDANVTLPDTSKDSIIRMIDAFLKEPRFEGDVCLILNMPENIIKKNKEKVNAAIWSVFNAHSAKKSLRLFDILIAIETMVDASKLTAILDNDIKLAVAKEMSITISEPELEQVAANVSKKKAKEAEEIPADEPEEKSYEDRLFEDDPEEEAEIMKDLI